MTFTGNAVSGFNGVSNGAGNGLPLHRRTPCSLVPSGLLSIRCLRKQIRHRWRKAQRHGFVLRTRRLRRSGQHLLTLQIQAALWDVATGEPVAKLTGHDDYVYSLAFSPDGARLASGSGDFTARIWDTRPVHARWRARAQIRRLSEDVRPLVEDLYERLRDPVEVIAAIGADPSLSEPARRAALLSALDLRPRDP